MALEFTILYLLNSVCNFCFYDRIDNTDTLRIPPKFGVDNSTPEELVDSECNTAHNIVCMEVQT